MTLFIGIILSILALLGIRNDKTKMMVFVIVDFIFLLIAYEVRWTNFWWFNIFLLPITSFLLAMLINFIINSIKLYNEESGIESSNNDTEILSQAENDILTFIRKNYGLLDTNDLILRINKDLLLAPDLNKPFFMLLLSYVYYKFRKDIDKSVSFAKMAMMMVDAPSTDYLVKWYRWIAETKEIASRIDKK